MINAKSIIRFVLFFTSFLLAILTKKIYRPWIYQREGWGFHVADWGPSLFFVFGMMMLTAALVATTGRWKHIKFPTMAGIALGGMLYEFSHAFRSDRWFSWEDITATATGGLMAFLVEWLLMRSEDKADR
jgi:hypothetical protein